MSVAVITQRTGGRRPFGMIRRNVPSAEGGAGRPTVALSVPAWLSGTGDDVGWAAKLQQIKADELVSGGLAVAPPLPADYDRPVKETIEALYLRLGEVGGLVIACSGYRGIVPTIVPMNALTLTHLHVATQTEGLEGKIFTDIDPQDWVLTDHGMTLTGIDADTLLGGLNPIVYGHNVDIIREGLRG